MAVESQVIFEALRRSGYRPTKLAVTGLEVLDFGRRLAIEFVCDDATVPPFKLLFRDCTEIHWDIFAEEEDVAAPLPGVPATPIATVIRMGAFRREFKVLTQLHTELFDVLVAHGSAALLLGDQEQAL